MTNISRAKSGFGLLKAAYDQWSADNALRLSAALAYYSIFSIAPLLVIAIAIAGWFFGHDAAQGFLKEELQGLLGGHAAVGVEGMVQSASQPSSSLLAGAIGTITLLLGASGVFGELKDALNTIWGVKAKPGQGVMAYVRQRLLSFGMVLVIGFLLLVSLLLTTALSGVTKYFGSAIPLSGALAGILGFVVSFGVITLLFAAIFKFLPDAKVRWPEVWIGAGFTALLFEIGKSLLGWYLGRESTASAYGAAASAILLLLWIYYASLILLFGAEFTRVYAQKSGARIEPNANAEPVTAEDRAEEGLENGARGLAVAIHHGPQPAKESPRLILGIMDEQGPAEPPAPIRDFVQAHPVAILLSAVGGGFAVGLATLHLEARPHLSPADQFKTGTRAVLLAGTAAAATYLTRVKSKTGASLENLHVLAGRQAAGKWIQNWIVSKIKRLG